MAKKKSKSPGTLAENRKAREGNRFNHDPLRTRKLLLHKKEIQKLGERTREIGYSIIPLKLYLKHGQCKVLLGVARGKKKYDKRQALKEKAVKRDIDRAVKARY
ncbi:MAG: SsrA-binding protein [Staphylococcus epidermidis]|nr:SsrA-binding protein [Staphylococcus epidermidis]